MLFKMEGKQEKDNGEPNQLKKKDKRRGGRDLDLAETLLSMEIEEESCVKLI